MTFASHLDSSYVTSEHTSDMLSFNVLPHDTLAGVPPLLQHFEEGLRQPAGQQLDHDPQQVDAVELRCFQTGGHCWLPLPGTREDCHLQ